MLWYVMLHIYVLHITSNLAPHDKIACGVEYILSDIRIWSNSWHFCKKILWNLVDIWKWENIWWCWWWRFHLPAVGKAGGKLNPSSSSSSLGRPAGPRMDHRVVTSPGFVNVLRLALRLQRSAQMGIFLDAIASPSTYPSDLPQAKV